MAEMTDGSGRWRVRWREEVNDGTTVKRVQRERKVRDEATAIALRAKILRAVETGELFQEQVKLEIRPATVDAILAGWLKAKAARGLGRNTIESYGGRINRILRTFRAMHKIDGETPIPGSVLTRDGVVDLTIAFRADGHSEGTIHGTIQSLVAAWGWASDDPTTYPGLTPAPRDTSTLTPRPPVYGAAPAPTMVECDAVVRRVAALGGRAKRIALPVAVIARCTGLRCGQVLGILAKDVDLEQALLTVRVGKGRRETSERRAVPLAPVLIPFLQPYVKSSLDAGPSAPLFPRRADALGRTRGGPDRTLRNAWTKAVEAKLVREDVWRPDNRKIGRPDHAFRAAFQAHLVRNGVAEGIIDYLVGHAGGLRDRHYVDADARLTSMRAAVACIPDIQWKGR